ncbi:hypothetical protein LC593_35355 [Nostoc sp. CHAB 5844]|nr:hypothetical protein [Nostoc sp. CHAB 5844]
MNSRILLPFLLFTLHACSNTNPIVGSWTSQEQGGELIISQQSNKFQASLSSDGVNHGVFPAEVSDKGFTFIANLGIGSVQYNCSLGQNKNELDCNLLTTTLFGSQTRPFKLVRKK